MTMTNDLRMTCSARSEERTRSCSGLASRAGSGRLRRPAATEQGLLSSRCAGDDRVSARTTSSEHLVGYSSGQRGQTVNLLAYAYEGSNPSPTTTLSRGDRPFRVSPQMIGMIGKRGIDGFGGRPSAAGWKAVPTDHHSMGGGNQATHYPKSCNPCKPGCCRTCRRCSTRPGWSFNQAELCCRASGAWSAWAAQRIHIFIS